ncbi:error-prone repair protein UmuD [Pseudoroseomonas deserti]|uniref:Error-prone repair protein UmuD n=1 Tax=Teichococcus deserti TaxID=1817963 RepID=A0A1V2H3Z0_9PROT|nr:S24 family peptidase [Pseudoroseomonas deserti]ONG53284.1 error-prone repair protein UmuD [Pseudoroseomonas deserti]
MGQQEPPGGYTGAETTGFVSPAGDSLEGPIDLEVALDLRRPNRYLVRVSGDALREHGILSEDILVTDAAIPPRVGAVAIVMLHGDVVVARLALKDGTWWLQSGRRGRHSVAVPEDAEIWGVATALVRDRM